MIGPFAQGGRGSLLLLVILTDEKWFASGDLDFSEGMSWGQVFKFSVLRGWADIFLIDHKLIFSI